MKRLFYSIIFALTGILQIFADEIPNDGANRTSDTELSSTMKEYYDKELLKNARNKHYFAQFGKHKKLPKGRGKTIEWRKWKTIDPALKPLVEGVVPTGKKLGQEKITATIKQYGDFAIITDQLNLHALDDVIVGATEEFGAASAETEDIVVRNGIHSSSDINVYYAGGVSERADIANTSYVDSKTVNRIATILKKNKTPTINGSYVALIHPSCSNDLRDSSDWIDFHKYSDAVKIFDGEIGKLHNVRFVESINCKVYCGSDDEAENQGTSNGKSVYCTYFFGLNAWGVVDPEGAGKEMIIKPVSSGGAENPLNQKGSIGYKFEDASVMLYPERLVILESTSSFGADDATN